MDGVYIRSRIVTKARKLNSVSYEEMLEMASLGAKRFFRLSLSGNGDESSCTAAGSFQLADTPGTLVIDEDEIVEKKLSVLLLMTPIGQDHLGRRCRPAWRRRGYFWSAGGSSGQCGYDCSNVSQDGKTTDVTFTVGKADLDRAASL